MNDTKHPAEVLADKLDDRWPNWMARKDSADMLRRIPALEAERYRLQEQIAADTAEIHALRAEAERIRTGTTQPNDIAGAELYRQEQSAEVRHDCPGGAHAAG